MSHTFHLVDDDAKTHLWVAQGWPKNRQLSFYSGDAKVMAALREMLLNGLGHTFRLLESSEVPDYYRDLTDDELHAAVAAHALPRFSIADPVTGEIVQLLEKRGVAHANTRAAVDLMTHLGVVMQEIVDQLDEDTILNMTPGPGSADSLRRMRDTLADALSDDQAVRAAFLEHFPHLCKVPDRPAGFSQPSSKDVGERSDTEAEKRGDFRHEESGVDFAELDKTRAQEAEARKAKKETDAES